MQAVMRNLIMLCAALTLTACSSNMFNFSSYNAPKTTHVPGVKVNGQEAGASELGSPSSANLPEAGPLAGGIEKSMDSNDRSKLNHALDNGIGKSSQWVNQNTGVTYSVVPTKKMTVGGNPYCRQYTVSAARGGKTQEKTGTACVSADSSWRTVSG